MKSDSEDEYDKEIIGKISDEKHWPRLDNIEMIKKMLAIADQQFDTKTIEGYLSSILIYQQILEEYLLNLLKLSNLYVQAEIWPARLNLKVRDRLMFGQLLEQHDRTIDFDNKFKLINECKEFNIVRIKFVHHLLKFKTDKDAFKAATVIKKKFYLITNYYFDGKAFLDWQLADLQNRIDWDQML